MRLPHCPFELQSSALYYVDILFHALKSKMVYKVDFPHVFRGIYDDQISLICYAETNRVNIERCF